MGYGHPCVTPLLSTTEVITYDKFIKSHDHNHVTNIHDNVIVNKDPDDEISYNKITVLHDHSYVTNVNDNATVSKELKTVFDVYDKSNALLDHTYVTSNNSMTLFKIAFVNVCGLHSKNKNPEFQEFIQNYDVLVLAETRTGDYNNIAINGYTIFPKL